MGYSEILGRVFIFFSLLALIFLLYSLANRKRLGLSLTHSRILTELIATMGFGIAAALLY